MLKRRIPGLLWLAGLLLMLLLLIQPSCQHLEPRWLLSWLPGEYPEVVYYFPTEQKLIALTIDDGPDPAATGQLLDLLAAHEAQATFFFLSENFNGNEALVRRALAEGHELGNHMTVDEVSARLEPDEFTRKLGEAAAALDDFGAEVRWFRPGSAWYTGTMFEQIRAYGYRIALASMVPIDARLPWPALVSAYIGISVEPGSIAVLHTGQGRGARTLEVLESVLPALEERGYRFVTLSQLDAAARSETTES